MVNDDGRMTQDVRSLMPHYPTTSLHSAPDLVTYTVPIFTWHSAFKPTQHLDSHLSTPCTPLITLEGIYALTQHHTAITPSYHHIHLPLAPYYTHALLLSLRRSPNPPLAKTIKCTNIMIPTLRSLHSSLFKSHSPR